MALTGKGSRSLIVDGTAYRWSVRRKPTYCQEMGWSNLSFAVETANGGLCTLHVITEATRADSVAASTDELPGSPSMAVTPPWLRTASGWPCNRAGSPSNGVRPLSCG